MVLSGPVAVEFLLFLMASATASGVKGVKSCSSLCRLWIFLMICLVDGSWRWVSTVVNCLLNLLAMDCCFVRTLPLKVIGWLGGVSDFLPFNDLMRSQNFLRLDLGVAVASVALQVSVASTLVWTVICWFMVAIEGSVGFTSRMESRWFVRDRIGGDKPGWWLGL